MTTDITELAQREKFEAWFVNDVVGADVNFPAFKDGEYAEGEIYDEQLYFMLQAMWMAWKAANAELVEALEKAQEGEKQWREVVDAFCSDDADWHKLTNSNNELISFLSVALCKQDDRIAELEPIRAAAEKLVRCKGRYHSELNYRALAALFGVTTPDLPPLDGESRTAMLQAGTFRENGNSSTDNFREIAETSTGTAITPAAPDKKLTDDVLDEIIAGAKTSMEQYLALSLKAEREVWRKEGPTDDERIMAIEGIHSCERCGDEGWVVGEMGITRCACGQAGNSPVIPEGLIAAVNRLLDSDGSRGCYSAIQCGDAHDEIERLLAAALQEVKP